jgi:hypothetical protein
MAKNDLNNGQGVRLHLMQRVPTGPFADRFPSFWSIVECGTTPRTSTKPILFTGLNEISSSASQDLQNMYESFQMMYTIRLELLEEKARKNCNKR